MGSVCVSEEGGMGRGRGVYSTTKSLSGAAKDASGIQHPR